MLFDPWEMTVPNREQTAVQGHNIGSLGRRAPAFQPIPMRQKPKSGRVAILVTDGFEQVELTGPRTALEKEGYLTDVVSPKAKTVKGVIHTRAGRVIPVDVPLSRAKVSDYDALLLPGGVVNPDSLRLEPKAVEFVRGFFQAGKPVAAICHGPIMLIEADVVKGRRMTSFRSIKTDLANAGAHWVDREVVVDGALVTSRTPADLPAFNGQMLKAFGAGKKRGA
jgi:protease I